MLAFIVAIIVTFYAFTNDIVCNKTFIVWFWSSYLYIYVTTLYLLYFVLFESCSMAGYYVLRFIILMNEMDVIMCCVLFNILDMIYLGYHHVIYFVDWVVNKGEREFGR